MKNSRLEFLHLGAMSTLALAAPIDVLKLPTGHPFEGVDWQRVLAETCTPFDRMCGANLDRTYYALGSGPSAHPGGYPVLTAGAAGFDASSNRWLAAVPLHCGGTAGITQVGVFAATSSGPVLIGRIRPYHSHLSVFFRKGALHVASALYEPGEPNSHWSRTHVERYDFSGTEPVVAEAFDLSTRDFTEAFGTHLRTSRLEGQAAA